MKKPVANPQLMVKDVNSPRGLAISGLTAALLLLAAVSHGAPLSHAASSPSGKMVFSREDGIYVLESVGSTAHRIWQAPAGKQGVEPQWSPNGKKIAFTGPDGNLWVMGADGSNARPIVQQAASGTGCSADYCQQSGTTTDSPRWSPDGSFISYRLAENLAHGSIWTVAADGSGEPHQIATSVDLCIFNEGWTPDLHPLFSRCAQDSCTTNATYSSVGAMGQKVFVTGSQIAYGPGGSIVAFSRQSMQGNDATVALYVSGADGIGVTLVAQGGQSPAWSSTGLLAYQVNGSAGWELHVHDPASGTDATLDTGASTGLLGGWTPDGGWLYFTTVDANGSVIHLIRADGSGMSTAATGSYPNWTP